MKALYLLMLALFVFGCSEMEEEEDVQVNIPWLDQIATQFELDEREGDGEEQVYTPWIDQIQAIQKAKQTQQVILDGVKRRRENLERQIQ